MSRNESSPRTLDLFEVTLTIPTPSFEPTRVSAQATGAGQRVDAELAQQLGQLVEEVQRRLAKGRGKRPDTGDSDARGESVP